MKYYRSLDGLRAYSVISVLLFHAHIFDLGWIGVHVFFVLSGFLITSILMNEINSPNYFKAFYGRRMLRIFPIYYMTLLTVILIGIVQKNRLDGVFSYLFYFQNINLGFSNFHYSFPKLFDHTWSLAVEEQFYLVFPLLVKLFYKSLKLILIGCMSIGVFVLVALSFRYPGLDINWTNPVTNFIFLGGGAYLANIEDKKRFLRFILPFCVASICLLTTIDYPVSLRNINGELFLFSLLPLILLLTTLLITSKNTIIINWLFRNPVVIYLGRISYGIYLFHYPIFVLGEQYGWPWIPQFIVTLVIAILSWHFFEKPVLGLKIKFSYDELPPVSEAIS